MKILVEGHTYEASLIRDICGGYESEQDGSIKVTKVGYYFSRTIGDCVLCLPKVVKDARGNTVLGGLRPESLIEAYSTEDRQDALDEAQTESVRSFSLWTYRAISTFARLNPTSSIVTASGATDITRDEDAPDGTLLDIILAIIRFYQENRDYFIYIIRNLHSGYERINWRKTIASRTPVLQEGRPLYFNVVNRKKQIDFDEELMVIFHSILNYISTGLGMTVRSECNYELITGAEFEAYLDGLGLVRLDAIKYKYFSDKDIKLWHLCHSFFEKSARLHDKDGCDDYLFIGSFELMFESMIDAIISDRDLPDVLKNQEDGKMVDHLFKYPSPIDGKPIYYIGDSKYYSIGSEVGDKSIYKQFTYAKNIIQYHFIASMQRRLEDIGYRDPLTEGYNFTPNFFISATVPDNLTYENTGLRPRDLASEKHRISHFGNRLFDRDTLWLTHFDINLLFIIALYARDDSSEQSSFRTDFKQKVRKAFTDLLSAKYDFYTLTPHSGTTEDFITAHFRTLNGKAYTLPDDRLILALEKDNADSAAVRSHLAHIATLEIIDLKDLYLNVL